MGYVSDNTNDISDLSLPWFADWRTLNVLLLVGTVACFVGYLVVNNRTASDGFQSHVLESRLTELEEQKRQLDLQMLDRQALGSVEARAMELGFVPVERIEYVSVGADSVALR